MRRIHIRFCFDLVPPIWPILGTLSGDHFTVRWCGGEELCTTKHFCCNTVHSDCNYECTHNRINVFKRYNNAWLFQGDPRSDVAMLTAASTVVWSSAMKLSAPYDTALVRTSFPLLPFVFHCSYSGFPKFFLLFSYSYASVPPILLFFSPLRHLSTKLHGVKSQIIILLNTQHPENLEGKRCCPCAYFKHHAMRAHGRVED